MRCLAPAKINLHLEILGRRDDGFHELETVFQTIDLADALEVVLDPAADGISLTCSDPSIPADGSNLVWKAAAAVLTRRPGVGGVRLHLDKRVPHGAGLGGGSSDAASVLLALNAQLERPLPAAELAAMALELGSDVPFFLVGGRAHALGRGEVLTALPPLPPLPLTILMPAVHLPTPQVFKALTAEERGPRPSRGAAWAATAPLDELLVNRLTAPAVRCCPAVGELLAWLEVRCAPHGIRWLMSGSGAACVAFAHVEPPPGVRAWQTWTSAGGPAVVR